MRLLLLLLAISATADDAQSTARAWSEAFARLPPPDVHLVLGEPRTWDCTLEARFKAPELQARRWQFVVAGPIALPWQEALASTLTPTGRRIADASPLRRPLLSAEASAGADRSASTCTWRLSARLRSVSLSEGAGTAPLPLPGPDRLAATRSAGLVAWDAPEVQTRLDQRGWRPRPGEPALDFARRILLEVRKFRYRYAPDLDRSAAAVLAAGESDCGGLAIAAVAALRAAGIPAQTLAGRRTESSRPHHLLDGHPYGQWHVYLALWIDGVGWIPCDAATGLERPEAWFARFDGDVVAMHADPGVRIPTMFGERELPWMQSFAYWVRGEGTLDGAQVDETWTVQPQ